MRLERCFIGDVIVIGLESEVREGENTVVRLWREANARFHEVEGLAQRDAQGNLRGVWGAMSDFSRAFKPWEQRFTAGLYLAGVQCPAYAVPPAGWNKWLVPGGAYACARQEGERFFARALEELAAQKMTLRGAAQEYICPRTSEMYVLFPIWEELDGERVHLRPWRAEDAEALYALARDPRVGPAAGWPPHQSVSESREIIATVLSESETYAVILKETNQVIGSISIMRPEHGYAPMQEGEAELGYWLGVPYWGQGLIPEAARLLLERCFGQFGLRGVWAGYFEGNDQSRRVQEKCGFRLHHTGESAGRVIHYTYLPREAWQK